MNNVLAAVDVSITNSVGTAPTLLRSADIVNTETLLFKVTYFLSLMRKAFDYCRNGMYSCSKIL